MSERFEAIVIGGGPNGLAAAAALAQAGRKVLLLEAGPVLGGAAAAHEFAPGFKAPVSHLVTHLAPEVITALRLEERGLRWTATDRATALPDPDEKPIELTADVARTAESIRSVSPADAAQWPRMMGDLNLFARTLAPFLSRVPPRIMSGRLADVREAGMLGLALRRMGREPMREFLRVVGMNIFDLTDEYLTHPRLRAAVCFDAVLGNKLAPRSPNSVLSLLYRLASGDGGRIRQPEGGMTGVIQAMERAANTLGVTTRTGTRVLRIGVDGDRIGGVTLDNGDTIESPMVFSTVGPRRTLIDLLGAKYVDVNMARRLGNFRDKGCVAKVHLALNAAPTVIGLATFQLDGRIVLARSPDAIETAFDPIKYRRMPESVVLEATLPSLHDPSLAPAGKHVMSIAALYAPYDLAGGWTDAAKADLQEKVLSALDGPMHGIRDLIDAVEVLPPPEIEARTGSPGGHWHHGELQPDQMFTLRPVPFLGQYAGPVKGLYLCGAGSHPGGGVSGLPGLVSVRAALGKEAA